jgi:hypothetical protein
VVLRVNGEKPDLARAVARHERTVWDLTFAGLDPDVQVAALETLQGPPMSMRKLAPALLGVALLVLVVVT